LPICQVLGTVNDGWLFLLSHRRPESLLRLQKRPAIRKNKKALATFEKFSESNKREYVEWVTEPKTEGTRKRHLETTVEWLSEGKARNWKYVKK